MGSSPWSTNVHTPSSSKIAIRKAVYVEFSNLLIGTTYQLQVVTTLNGASWQNFGTPFTATNITMTFSNYWNVSDWNELFFRLSQ